MTTIPHTSSDLIVIVEAIESSRLLFSSWFSARGNRVFTFADPTTALLLSNGLKVDVLLLGPSSVGAGMGRAIEKLTLQLRSAEPNMEVITLRRRDQPGGESTHSDAVVILEEPWTEQGLLAAIADRCETEPTLIKDVDMHSLLDKYALLH